jgi:hypothetical protein
MSGFSTMNYIRGGASSSGSTGNASVVHPSGVALPSIHGAQLDGLDFFEIQASDISGHRLSP